MVASPDFLIDDVAIPKVEYSNVKLKDVSITLEPKVKNKANRISSLMIGDEIINYTDRFSGSLTSLYGFSNNMYKFFDPVEIIGRIIDRGFGDTVRVALQLNSDGSKTALGVTNPKKSFISSNDLFIELMERGIDSSLISYHNGVVRSWHKPTRVGNLPFEVKGDQFVNRFIMDTPVDGFGNPSAYLSVLRLVCSNGAVGFARAFKSFIQIGNDSRNNAIPVFRRFLDSYNNEEGFSAIRQRVESASSSPASLDEFYSLYKVLTNFNMGSLHGGSKNDVGFYSSDVVSKLSELAGDALKLYGLVSLDALAAKQRRKVPVKCTVLDLVNFASELATHKADSGQSRRISGWVGSTLSDSGGYDLEGTLQDGEQLQDLFVTPSGVAHEFDEAKEIN